MAELFKTNSELLLHAQIYNYMTPITFKMGSIEVYLDPDGDRDSQREIVKKLREWTGEQWIISLVSETRKTDENITLAEKDSQKRQEKLANAVTHPILEKVLENFPGAKIVKLQDI